MKRYSILTNDMKKCYLTGTTQNIHIHEIYFGSANRKKSIEHGFCVPLKAELHNMSSNGVHFNHELDLRLKRECQAKFEETHTREEFIRIIGRNYL